jgi:peptide deformylase
VRIYGDPVLREKAREVTAVDETLRQLIADLRETMKAYGGVGLAANQVGVAQRVIVVDVPLDEEERAVYALVNPVIKRRHDTQTAEEGCLSVPGIWEEVTRAGRILVQGLDEQGRPLELDAEGYLARAIQHEIDHLDGALFVDRLSLLKRQFLRRSLDALARGELPEDYHPPVNPSPPRRPGSSPWTGLAAPGLDPGSGSDPATRGPA